MDLGKTLLPENEIYGNWIKTLNPKQKSLFHCTFFTFLKNCTYAPPHDQTCWSHVGRSKMLKKGGGQSSSTSCLIDHETHRLVGKDISQRTPRYNTYECFQHGGEKRQIEAFIGVVVAIRARRVDTLTVVLREIEVGITTSSSKRSLERL